MIRRLGFGLMLLTAVIIVACGRQVTPNPVGIGPGGAPAGYMTIFFDVASPFNFSNYQYWVIFDTAGDEQTPSTQPFDNNWAGYSAGIEVFGNGGSTSAQPVQFIKEPSKPHSIPQFKTLPFTPQTFIYNANSNGSGTEFSVTFQRSIFLGLLPNPPPLAVNWTYNAFTTQANVFGQLIFDDSMGAGGKNFPQYSSPVLSTYQCFDRTFYALSSGLQMDPASQIESVEIANNPSPAPAPSATPCPASDDARGVIVRISK
jgi:hypothetical protein